MDSGSGINWASAYNSMMADAYREGMHQRAINEANPEWVAIEDAGRHFIDNHPSSPWASEAFRAGAEWMAARLTKD